MEPTPTILVVDDVPLFRELESLFLARCGRVVTACDAAARPSRVAARERPAVIVLDAHLPDVSGRGGVPAAQAAAGPTADRRRDGQRLRRGARRRDPRRRGRRAREAPLAPRARRDRAALHALPDAARPAPRHAGGVGPHPCRADAEAWGTGAQPLARRHVRRVRGGCRRRTRSSTSSSSSPGSREPLRPTAQVVWRRARRTARARGSACASSARRAGGARARRVRPRVGAPGRARASGARRAGDRRASAGERQRAPDGASARRRSSERPVARRAR